jgi:hypothetical protein
VDRRAVDAFYGEDDVVAVTFTHGRFQLIEPADGLRRDSGVLECEDGAASVASFLAAVLAGIYLCSVCSCQEILSRNGRG